jgi:hypothetical protein
MWRTLPVDLGALRRVPYAVAQRLRVLPLVLNDHSLVVAIEDVTRRAVLDELEFVAQTKVVPALAVAADIDEVLKAAYARIGQGDDRGMIDAKDGWARQRRQQRGQAHREAWSAKSSRRRFRPRRRRSSKATTRSCA